MKAFKYLIFLLILTPTFVHAKTVYYISDIAPYKDVPHQTALAACKSLIGYVKYRSGAYVTITDADVRDSFSCNLYYNSAGTRQHGGTANYYSTQVSCPSAQEINLKVALNAQTYQCVQGCQYRLTACVDVDFEAGMTCTAISTGIDCGQTPPPTSTSGPTTPDTGTPATPNQSPTGTNTNTATTTGTSTSTSTSTSTATTENNTTTTNTTTNTTITNNTTTTIDLSSLESTIKSIGSILGTKLDAIKDLISDTPSNGNSTDLTETNQKLDDIKNNTKNTNNWLQGKNEDGTGGGIGDNPFGTDQTPEKALTPQDLETNIFVGSAICPADRTLSFQLFTGKTFSKSFSFSMWCDKLAIFGTLILIASYLYGAYIITSKS